MGLGDGGVDDSVSCSFFFFWFLASWMGMISSPWNPTITRRLRAAKKKPVRILQRSEKKKQSEKTFLRT